MGNDEERERLEDEAVWDEERAALMRRLTPTDFAKNEEIVRRQFMKERAALHIARRAAAAVERSAAEAAAARESARHSDRKTNWGIAIALVALIVAAWPNILALLARIEAALR